jgi:hypothetical protein
MPRGFVRAVYVSDDGTEFALLVDADHAGDPGRGWTQPAGELLAYAPRGFLPRRVVGVDETGRQQTALIGNIEAPLWTGVQTTFSVEASDQTTIEAIVVLRQQEVQFGPGNRPT